MEHSFPLTQHQSFLIAEQTSQNRNMTSSNEMHAPVGVEAPPRLPTDQGAHASAVLAVVIRPTTGRSDLESNNEKNLDEHVYSADSLSTPRQILLVLTLCTAMFTNQVGLGNTLTTAGIIGNSFGLTSTAQFSWLIAGYSLTIGTFILVGGRLGDEFGNKRMFVLGMGWYALWSLVCGLSVYSGHVLFIFARIFQGMGPALTLPNALAILGHSYAPGPKRNMSFAWFGGSAPFGAIAGLLFGGIFSLAWWPWTYWSQAIALVCVAVFGAWVIPSEPSTRATEQRTTRERIDSLDLPGAFTGVTALVLVNFAWNQASVVGWQQPYVYICPVLGVVFGVVFFSVEVYWASSPHLAFSCFQFGHRSRLCVYGNGLGYIWYLGQYRL